MGYTIQNHRQGGEEMFLKKIGAKSFFRKKWGQRDFSKKGVKSFFFKKKIRGVGGVDFFTTKIEK